MSSTELYRVRDDKEGVWERIMVGCARSLKKGLPGLGHCYLNEKFNVPRCFLFFPSFFLFSFFFFSFFFFFFFFCFFPPSVCVLEFGDGDWGGYVNNNDVIYK